MLRFTENAVLQKAKNIGLMNSRWIALGFAGSLQRHLHHASWKGDVLEVKRAGIGAEWFIII